MTTLKWVHVHSEATWEGDPPPRIARAAIEGAGWMFASRLADGGWSIAFVPDPSASQAKFHQIEALRATQWPAGDRTALAAIIFSEATAAAAATEEMRAVGWVVRNRYEHVNLGYGKSDQKWFGRETR